MTRFRNFLAGAVLTSELVTGPLAGAADGPNAAAPSPATNAAPAAWSWTPTAEQKELEGGKYFSTAVDAAHHVVQHRLFNRAPVTAQETSLCTLIRTVGPDGRGIGTAEIGVRRALSEPACYFDGLQPLVFLVDGVRFEVPCDLARVGTEKEDAGYGLVWRSLYFTMVSDDLVRALGKAGAASVEVPCRRGAKWVHQFGPEELARFATFVRVYLPPPAPAPARPKN